jgi:hypothetical protein
MVTVKGNDSSPPGDGASAASSLVTRRVARPSSGAHQLLILTPSSSSASSPRSISLSAPDTSARRHRDGTRSYRRNWPTAAAGNHGAAAALCYRPRWFATGHRVSRPICNRWPAAATSVPPPRQRKPRPMEPPVRLRVAPPPARHPGASPPACSPVLLSTCAPTPKLLLRRHAQPPSFSSAGAPHRRVGPSRALPSGSCSTVSAACS